MITMKKSFASIAICSALFFTGVITTSASTDSNSNVQNAYYYIGGQEYEVPKEDIDSFINQDDDFVIPQDSNKPEIKEGKFSQNIEPRGNACYPGDRFDGSRTSAGFQKGRSGSRVINDTSNTLEEVSKLSSNTTISGYVSGSGSWGWGPIEATAGFEIGGSKTWYTSQSTKIKVQPGDWGWIDYGTHSETWKGYYYYLSGDCYQHNKNYLTVKGPKYKAKLARTERYPY
ncbi:hypothetical protein BN1058_02368 [Paraliobacillus sp. PM-2]|uniref:hypothetical protein n=1 Tax=Paraliobacillus sp. PM-2 TaxID=1462524 RepID=UPI00061CB464|nr:hypothetical protein [Paraliobacillus sp. PM-2]CQR48026.1 hypothetical protein BN1058_02368 [Paraliobacillus sp. PM-2]